MTTISVSAAELPIAATHIEGNIPASHAAMPVVQCVDSGSIEPKFHVPTDTGNSLPLNVNVGVVEAMSTHGTAGHSMK